MDVSRYKRRERQTRRQQPQIDSGSTDTVPEVVSERTVTTAPLLNEIIPKQHVSKGKAVDGIVVRKASAHIENGEQAADAQEYNAVPAHAQRPPMPAIDMGLPGDESPARPARSEVKVVKKRGFKTIALRSTAAVLIFGLGLGGLLFSQGYLKLHKVFKGNATTAASLTTNVNPDLLKGEGDGRINVLLLGRGGGTHDAPDLTDTIVLASIDPVNHTSTLLSVPRDLWVDIPNQGAMKINAAWEMGEFKQLGKVSPGSTDPQAIQAGFDMADQVVETVLGVPINYNVIVDFQAFKQGVDTVGGVTVNVPTDLIDPTMAWENGNSSVLARAGIQNFDGKHALIYVRSRETSSDFARSQRQRSVMLALKDKVDTLGTLSNPLKISGLMSAFGNNVQTDFSLKDASRFYSIVKQIGDDKVGSIGLADGDNHYIKTGNMNGQSAVIPTSGLFNYTDIQKFVRTQLKDGYIVKENAKILILNGTTVPGAATTKAEELKSYGYNVVGVGQAPTTGYDKTELINLSGTKNKYTAHYLERRLNTTAVLKLPNSSIQANGANFVIILGSDEATSQ